jgi:leader peptidase (prepilin peptidase)/N-methyltransferase
MLIILSVSDISYFIIPDEVLIFFSGYFIIINCLKSGIIYSLFSILSGLALFGVMYGIMLFGNWLFKKESLGGGDVKLMFVFGLIINPLLGLLIIFLASVLALPISLIILHKKRQNLVPFGPFLLISFTFIYFTGITVDMFLDFLRLF